MPGYTFLNLDLFVYVVLIIITSIDHYFLGRLIRLVLTLSVSTATTERAFSAMKVVKTRLRNKMEDGFLRDCLITYIEKEIAMEFTTDTLIDDFYAIKNRRVRLNYKKKS